jgi:hypothetical protein
LTLLFRWGCGRDGEEDEKRRDGGWELHCWWLISVVGEEHCSRGVLFNKKQKNMSKKVCEYLFAEGFCLLGGCANL